MEFLTALLNVLYHTAFAILWSEAVCQFLIKGLVFFVGGTPLGLWNYFNSFLHSSLYWKRSVGVNVREERESELDGYCVHYIWRFQRKKHISSVGFIVLQDLTFYGLPQKDTTYKWHLLVSIFFLS